MRFIKHSEYQILKVKRLPTEFMTGNEETNVVLYTPSTASITGTIETQMLVNLPKLWD